jgi:Tetratricopeptide repeat/Cytochrome c554 and c-prime
MNCNDILGPLIFLLAFLVLVASCARAADYVGSQACAACHPAIYRSFRGTPMANGSGPVGTGEPRERFDRTEFRDSGGAFSYRVGQEAGKYFFEFREQGVNKSVEGQRQLEYFVGSGAAARSYLLSYEGFLYEAPVAYYSSSDSWKSAPGYAAVDYPYLTRPILPGCLACHASGIQWIPGTQNAYASPPFREGGVSCERCHGPGSDHIAKGAPLVNPVQLAAAQRDSICEQCHLSGEIRVPKSGKDDLAFRPGDRLADDLTVFVRSGSPSLMRVTSHAEDLAQSACKRASGEKLWCGTCHDPHSVPSPDEKAAYFRGKCLTCHQASDCSAPQSTRLANRDNCVACHMPRNPPSDVEHVVFTDHAIRRRPRPPGGPLPADADLVPFGGGTASTRDLGLAYAMVGLRERNPVYIERAFQLLQQTVASGRADAPALAYLAEFYRDRKDDAHALPLYEVAWRKDTTQYAVAAALGAYEMQRGNFEQAIRFWNQALAINPAMVLVRINLATALLRTGHAEQAQATLRKALEFQPSLQEARDLLTRITK